MSTKPVITLEEVQAQAAQAGYTISIDEDQVLAVNTEHPQVFQMFERISSFTCDQSVGAYTLLQVSYWIRGYALTDGDDGTFLLHRLPKHPAYTPTERVAIHLDYVWNCSSHLRCLHSILQCWITTVEQLEQPEALRTLGKETNPEALRDERLGLRARQLKTGQEGMVEVIWRWSRDHECLDFLWVQGNGYRFCDLEENLDLRA